MKLLLDTNVVYDWLVEPSGLSAGAIQSIRSADQVFVSAAVPWEMSIKIALGKLELQFELIPAIAQAGFEFLPVQPEHGWRAGQLPLIHKDPFDRLFVAQAEQEGLVLVTRDRDILKYAIATMPA